MTGDLLRDELIPRVGLRSELRERPPLPDLLQANHHSLLENHPLLPTVCWVLSFSGSPCPSTAQKCSLWNVPEVTMEGTAAACAGAHVLPGLCRPQPVLPHEAHSLLKTAVALVGSAPSAPTNEREILLKMRHATHCVLRRSQRLSLTRPHLCLIFPVMPSDLPVQLKPDYVLCWSKPGAIWPWSLPLTRSESIGLDFPGILSCSWLEAQRPSSK